MPNGGSPSAGDAEFLLVNLGDPWLEPVPQNVPGTWEVRSNWKRKTRYSLEQVHQFGALRETLTAIDKARKKESENDA